MREWNVGLQQYEIKCTGCKQKIIEDEVVWFETIKGLVCQDCFCKLMGVSNLEELIIKELLEEIVNFPGRRPEDCDDMKNFAEEALRIIAKRCVK